MLFQGQEFGSLRAVPVLRRSRRRAAGRRCARGGRSSCASFRALATPEAQAHARRPGSARDVRALQAGSASARRTPRRWRCTAICWRCAAPIRRSRSSAPARLHGAVLGGTGASVAVSPASAGDRLLLVNLGTDLDSSPRSRAAAGAAARQTVGARVVERGIPLRRRRRAGAGDRRGAGVLPARIGAAAGAAATVAS